ncbi:MAG TPA: glycosyltransferase family 1 protein [Deltaproteobacteria bacterium]|nr:glycosyltransferase family 1 protein [Deltaproteobacteria bacterium]
MKIRSFRVIPTLPETLNPILSLAYNAWCSWNQRGLRLFRHMDRDLWEETSHNPVEMLSRLSQGRIMDLMEDEGFLSQMKRTTEEFDDYMSETGVYSFLLTQPIDFTIAYFSMEFGLIESLPIYSGGLGILAGDHLKSASDLRLPLCGVGLMYKHGYFTQYLSWDGWQQEASPNNDFYHMTLILEQDSKNQPVKISVNLAGRQCWAQIWKCQVGRVPLYLLDTYLEENHPEDRMVTGGLYAGSMEDRLRQEIVLGVGGMRALEALGIESMVYHMNEGHSFLVGLECIRVLMKKHNLDFHTAREVVRSSLVFTTHTPVPAGNDVFEIGLVEKYLKPYVDEIGIKWSDFLGLGRKRSQDDKEPFGATVFALKNSTFCNGVSKLHGEVSRDMWKDIWPHVKTEDIPISSITNGIHIPSWISDEMADLFDRYLGPRWKEDPDNQKVWERIDEIPDAELWATHQRRRERLVAFARRKLGKQLQARGAKPSDLQRAMETMHPDALTIGFAKRFATYKRGLLLYRDIERLKTILSSTEHPVQIIVSGKAHPRDHEGKTIIQKIIHIAREEPFRDRIVFLEDYNMNIGRYLVEGVDIWLNTPRRPLEACGTSGMKATANGALNLSIQDGWWVEGYQPDLGWSIGNGEVYENLEYQDQVESKAIYDLLEREIIPLFYDRGLDGLPRRWIAMMKRSMRTLCPMFNSNRMVEEYTDRCYMSAALNLKGLVADDFRKVKDLVKWKEFLFSHWDEVRVVDINHEEGDEVSVHTEITVKAEIHLGALGPSDISARVYFGTLDDAGNLSDTRDVTMDHIKEKGKGNHLFEARINCTATGRFGYTVRILPSNPNLVRAVDLGLICWA